MKNIVMFGLMFGYGFLSSSAQAAIECPQVLNFKISDFKINADISKISAPSGEVNAVLDFLKSSNTILISYDKTENDDSLAYKACQYTDPSNSGQTAELQYTSRPTGASGNAYLSAAIAVKGTHLQVYISSNPIQIGMDSVIGIQSVYLGMYYPSTCSDDQGAPYFCYIGQPLGLASVQDSRVL